MRSRWTDIAFGLILVAVAAGIGVSFSPRRGLNETFVVSSGFFPLVVCAALFVSGLCMVATACRHPPPGGRFSINNPLLLVAVIAAAAAYTLLLPVLGYAVATSCFVLCVMLLLGLRTWRAVVSLPILLSLALYVVLDILAGLPLPSGRIL